MLLAASTVIIILVSLLITRIATTALTLTGLTREVARFQARSAFTGAGFTTTESEQVIGHPLRRRIVMTLMLVGNAGLVTTVATLSLSFAQAEGTGQALQRVGVLIGGLVGLIFLARNKIVDKLLTRMIERGLRRFTDLDVRDYAGLLRLSGNFVISELLLQEGDWLAGRPLSSLKLTDEGVIVLGVERADGYYLGAPTGGTELHAGDTLLLYGAADCLGELDSREQGPAGDRAHRLNVRANQQRVQEEQAEDRKRRRPLGRRRRQS